MNFTGIKILWEANDFLQISVPSEFKKRVCGLCGNYNSDPGDDFMSKRGYLINQVENFARSYRVSECNWHILLNIVVNKSVSKIDREGILWQSCRNPSSVHRSLHKYLENSLRCRKYLQFNEGGQFQAVPFNSQSHTLLRVKLEHISVAKTISTLLS